MTLNAACPVVSFPIADIVVDPAIQVRYGYDEPTIVRYMETFDVLPPVDVFVDPVSGDWLLAAGFHRTEAARRLGRSDLKVTRHTGDRAAAIEFAALSNIRHGLPLDRAERNRAILRLSTIGNWTVRPLADEFGVSHQTVQGVLAASKVRDATQEPAAGPSHYDEDDDEDDAGLSDTHYVEISRTAKKYWQPLVDVAVEEGWDSGDVRAAATILKNPRVSEEDKQALLDGDAALEDFRKDGTRLPPSGWCSECRGFHRVTEPHHALQPREEGSVPEPRQMVREPTFGDVKAEIVAEVEPYETAARLRRLLYAIDVETRVEPEAYVNAIPAETRQRLLGLVQQSIERLTRLNSALAAGSSLRELVRP